MSTLCAVLKRQEGADEQDDRLTKMTSYCDPPNAHAHARTKKLLQEQRKNSEPHEAKRLKQGRRPLTAARSRGTHGGTAPPPERW